MQKPAPPPEAPLIRLVRLAARLTSAQAAEAAGISKARWSQVENGYERRDGQWYPVMASDGLLARMAAAIGLDADRLASAGRQDAAAIVREMQGRRDAPDAGEPEGNDLLASLTPDERRAAMAFVEAIRAGRVQAGRASG